MEKHCHHCNEIIPAIHSSFAEEGFCCQGCETVFQILKSTNLDGYYKLYDQFSDQPTKKPIKKVKDYSFLDDPIYLEEEGFEDKTKMTFFLEGIHCVACLWLLEKIPQISPNIVSSQVNMALSTVMVEISPGGSFKEVATLLEKLGYPPHPLKSESDREKLVEKDNKKWLMRLGVTAALTGNIMLLNFAIYAGASGYWEELFNYITLALVTPVLTYGAYPFYQSAMAGLRLKKISIDTPIALALILGSIISTVNVFLGSKQVYFDSLCSLVFLLLASRYLLRRMNQKAMSSKRYLTNLMPRHGNLIDVESGSVKKISAKNIKVDDILLVEASGVVPTDGILLDPADSIDDSTFTGESRLKQMYAGQKINGGFLNKGTPFRIKASIESNNSRIGKILAEVRSHQFINTETSEFADKVAQWFVGITLIFGSIMLIYLIPQGPLQAFERFLSFIIIICPCALALATPLSFSVGLSKALNLGIVFKSARSLESLAKIETIFFDKTGTITQGDMRVTDHQEMLEDPVILELVYLMELQSEHPIGKAISNYLRDKEFKNKVSDIVVKEVPGRGPTTQYSGSHYCFKSLPIVYDEKSKTNLKIKIGFFKDDQLACVFSLEDSITEEVIQSIQELHLEGLKVKLLSGDISENVERIGGLLNLSHDSLLSGKTPEEKNEIIKNSNFSAMVGDGANDALSLKSADVGISVTGSLEVTTEAADVILTKGGSELALKAFLVAKETSKVIKRNFTISVVYNVVGGGLAIFGYVTPLFAAVLMPLSSLTVVLSAVYATKKLRELN